MRISDWSSDVCSSDLGRAVVGGPVGVLGRGVHGDPDAYAKAANCLVPQAAGNAFSTRGRIGNREWFARGRSQHDRHRSEEHTSELQSLMRISYAVFCLNKKNINNT